MNSSQKSAVPRSAFQELASVASELNSSTDELKRAISDLDLALKKLNMGISVWIPFNKDGSDTGSGTHEVGYDKIKGEWSIAIRRIKIETPMLVPLPAPQKEDIWLFGDAPRSLRLAAVPALGKMIARLKDSASTALKRVQARLDEVKKLTGELGLNESTLQKIGNQ